MGIKTHPNWERFHEDRSIEHMFFEDQDSLYEIKTPRSFECKLRKISIAKAREILDTLPSSDVDDGDDFLNAWDKAMGDSAPMIETTTWRKTVSVKALK